MILKYLSIHTKNFTFQSIVGDFYSVQTTQCKSSENVMTVTPDEVRKVYNSILQREPIEAEIILWLGISSIEEVIRMCLTSEEYQNSTKKSEDINMSPQDKISAFNASIIPVMQKNINLDDIISISPKISQKNNISENLIFDIGMSEGNDTAYYLEKGFDVIGIEADPVVYEGLLKRFSSEIANRKLIIFNRAVSGSDGETLTFWRNEAAQGLSSLKKHVDPGYDKSLKKYDVTSMNWCGIIAIAGTPHYCKIDVEGAERSFLDSMLSMDSRPTYISSEIHSFEPIEALYGLGYRRFKIVDQNILHTFLPLPNPPLEGLFVQNPNWHHASGPFGKELLGEKWLNFSEVAAVYDILQRLRKYRTVNWTWFDIHAWNDNE